MRTRSETAFDVAHASSALPPATGSTHLNVGPTERLVSTLGGVVLTALALRDLRSPSGISLLLGGGLLLFRGITGYCAVNNLLGRDTANVNTNAMEVDRSVRVNKPRTEVYAYWRKLANLPRFMHHIDSVEELSEKRSRWTARVPGGIPFSWEAEIVDEKPNERLSWASRPGSTIDNAGEVLFQDTTDGRGTIITSKISYRLPAGDAGGVAAKWFSPLIRKMMKKDLRRFREMVEEKQTSGKTEAQRSGARSATAARVNVSPSS